MGRRKEGNVGFNRKGPYVIGSGASLKVAVAMASLLASSAAAIPTLASPEDGKAERTKLSQKGINPYGKRRGVKKGKS